MVKKPEVLNADQLNIVYVSLDAISPYLNNPKLHSPSNIKKLVASMTINPGKIIFHQPISLDKDNVIIAGHGRRLAALELGLKSVPCVYPDVSEQEAIALRLADNESFSLEYDLQLMQQESEKLSAELKTHIYPEIDYKSLAKEADDLLKSVMGEIKKSPLDTEFESQSKPKTESTTVDDTDDDIDDDEKPDRLETTLCKTLSADLHGEIEVKTPIGYIDIMTESEIIEVKRVRKWKWALGQILVYGLYHPDKQKRIHLFGRCKDTKLQSIKDHCAKFDIVVTWQYEEFRP